MKKTAIFLTFILLFGLCSCSNTTNGSAATVEPAYSAVPADEEPERTERIPDETSAAHTESIPRETSAAEEVVAEPAFIMYLGEKISAPADYPGVPKPYFPVLDDNYLYAMVSNRYSELLYAGKATSDMRNKCDRAHDDIRQRGYLPYPGQGLGMNGGYALFDLDGDGSPELLLFSHRWDDAATPRIEAVYTIRGGSLVCVDDATDKSGPAVLAADGTFYHAGGSGYGYVNLRAFFLEPGARRFTDVYEARSALSFADGGVPAPYWEKTVNGVTVGITEEEFDALYERFEKLEWAALELIPLHPGETVAQRAETPPPDDEPMDYPEAYQDAPEAYKPILDALFLLDDHMRREEYGNGADLAPVGFTEYPKNGDLGYALADVNGDGVLELLLGTEMGLGKAAPRSIFTLKDGEPVFLESFWSRSYGAVASDGTIYNVGSGGWAYTSLTSYTLEENADTLTLLTHISSDYSAEENEIYYVQVEDGKNRYISEREFWDLHEIYDDPPDKMELNFIPVTPRR